MERLETRLKYFLLLICTISSLICCQNLGLPTEGQSFTEENFILSENSSVSNFNEAIEAEYTPLRKAYPNLGEYPTGIWLKKVITATSPEAENYTFLTRGVDTLRCYLTTQSGTLLDSATTGGHINPVEREFTSSFSTYTFTLKPTATVTLYLFAKNVNYKLSLYPYKILPTKAAKSYINKSQLIQSTYIGAMLILLLFGTTLFLLFQNTLYMYYAFCVALSLSMMLVNYDYSYLVFDQLPSIIINKNIYGIITTLLPLNYFLFARSFLLYNNTVKKRMDTLIPYVIGITAGILVIFTVFDLSFFKYRNLIEGIIFILILLPLVLLYFSFKHGYKPAWFFLIATLPVLAMGVLESLSDLHNFPVQQMHTYYYATTFFELFVLTVGLSIKFKKFQEERNYVYQQMLDREITTREKERIRIAQDLHDRLGGLIAATKLQFKMVKDRITASEDTSFDTGMEMLDNTADSIRQIAHSFSSSSFVKTGLLNALKEQYNEYTNPSVFINESGFGKRLPLDQEQPLYAIIQELITNAIKHANAQEVLVLLKETKEGLSITVEDDGGGFDVRTTTAGMGIENIRFRVKEHLSGSLLIKSELTKGTVVQITFERK